jgi:hypothetical protein
VPAVRRAQNDFGTRRVLLITFIQNCQIALYPHDRAVHGNKRALRALGDSAW